MTSKPFRSTLQPPPLQSSICISGDPTPTLYLLRDCSRAQFVPVSSAFPVLTLGVKFAPSDMQAFMSCTEVGDFAMFTWVWRLEMDLDFSET
ncbi:hypothetical protein CDL15_Pgr023738 [Punica granatum]|uniref:Uncharacterized protein n=1 Tax=Punica granatum TaxID=22663 RepID=A0A218WQT1_PUNGR|nr:hypothetical protein CDL15_Pgr023738 [Punica granatum]